MGCCASLTALKADRAWTPIVCPQEQRRRRSPHGCGAKQVVLWLGVLGRRPGCEPPHDTAKARGGRPSFSVRILAMDRHRRRAADGLRVAKGLVAPCSGWTDLSAIRSTRPRVRLDPVTFGQAADHAIPWSRLRDEAPSLVNGGERMPGSIVSGLLVSCLFCIGRIASALIATPRHSLQLFTRLIVFCYTIGPIFRSARNLTPRRTFGFPCQDPPSGAGTPLRRHNDPLSNICLTAEGIMSRL